MKKLPIILLLLLLPIFLYFNTIIVRQYRGPYYTNTNYDPSYVYLISALNLSRLKTTNYIDHPGIPVQLIGGIVVWLHYSFSNATQDVAKDLLLNPETYLTAIDNILIGICCAALFFLGLMIYYSEKNVISSLLFQLAPFMSINILYVLTLFTSDNLIISVVLVFTGFTFFFIRRNPDLNQKNKSLEIIFGLICGTGLATKVTFAPLLCIPLILIPGIRKKIIFSCVTIVTFLIFLLPGFLRLGYYFDFMKNIFIRSGRYGTGEKDFINVSLFFDNIKEIITTQKFLIAAYLFILAVLMAWFISRFILKRNSIKDYVETKLLLGIFISITFQIIITGKQYSPRYVIPALLLAIPGVYIATKIIFNSVHFKYKVYFQNGLIAILIIFFVIKMEEEFRNAKTFMIKNKEETTTIIDIVAKDYSGSKMIINFGSSSQAYALNMGVSFGGNQRSLYKSILKDIYPDKYFFELWKKKVYSFSEADDVRSSLFSGDKVYLQSTESGYNKTALDEIKKYLIEELKVTEPEFEKKISNEAGEAVYEIKYR